MCGGIMGQYNITLGHNQKRDDELNWCNVGRRQWTSIRPTWVQCHVLVYQLTQTARRSPESRTQSAPIKNRLLTVKADLTRLHKSRSSRSELEFDLRNFV